MKVSVYDCDGSTAVLLLAQHMRISISKEDTHTHAFIHTLIHTYIHSSNALHIHMLYFTVSLVGNIRHPRMVSTYAPISLHKKCWPDLRKTHAQESERECV